MFDYKFIIILGLSLVVYFLYKEVEALNMRMNALEVSKIHEVPKIHEAPKIHKLIELPPMPVAVPIPMEEYSNENIPIFSHDGLDTNTNESYNTLDMGAIDSIIGMAKENEPKIDLTLDVLLKNKLSELQNMASSNNINLFVENTKKKKTKIELANDILSSKMELNKCESVDIKMDK